MEKEFSVARRKVFGKKLLFQSSDLPYFLDNEKSKY